ncbi:integration host factor [Bacteroidia bacterium]|nr:integration host factor [Bacteroidia bacterium]
MDERLSLQDLIDLLAKKQEITKKDAEAFLRELIAVVTENIEANESVKIKDLGTFKLVKVNARKSVDVNTGEAIEIAAHYKLSFNPDKLLKESVNRPFAHFESVVLEEGVTFDNIESEIEEEKGEEVEEDVTIEEEITENISETATQPVGIINTDIPEEEVVEELADEVAEPSATEEKIIEPASKYVPEDIIAKIEEEAASHNVNIEDILLVIKEDKLKDKKLASKMIDDDDGDLVYEDIVPKRKGIRKRYITLAFFIFLIIAGFVVGGLYFQEIVSYFDKATSDSENNMQVAEAPVPKPQADVILMDTLDTVKKDVQEPNPLLKDRGRDMQAPPPPPVKPAEAVTPQASANGAIGVETIQPGHTLRNIALKYYGNKSFWVYIYEENKGKIKNVNNVPLGTKLTIPAPVKYGINPQDEESVKKARAKEAVLFEKVAEGAAK